jgi:hypothetical protein
MSQKSDRKAYERLVSRVDRDAYWSEGLHEYVLPGGAVLLRLGNAAALGVQVAVLLRGYPNRFAAARRGSVARG